MEKEENKTMTIEVCVNIQHPIGGTRLRSIVLDLGEHSSVLTKNQARLVAGRLLEAAEILEKDEVESRMPK